MSTFMGLAWIDLVPGADAGAALAAFGSGMSSLSEGPAGFALDAGAAPVELPGGRWRLEAVADGNYGQLADLVVWLAEGTGLVSHAFVALDHDEFGAENIVVDARDGVVRRAYHYFAYPRSDDTGAYYTEGGPGVLGTVPVIETPTPGVDPGVLADGPLARGTIAQRYRVPVAAIDAAAAADPAAHRESGIVGGPSSHWLDALGLTWPGEES